ncbi:FxsB family cyclophane-forming radical SAM/SPASM peptide maturase [Nonomuraea sp. NPDC049400]|uniref:FxsB family cyclophane-forming radical SAM/SPASM peptide maturase n=1 Tax=Nonomuraea sp. NPDC049400 TaxID=3364352 RepID=UPI00379DBBD9
MDALQRAGWRPLPFTQFVIKIHSRCNLACDYCYMYEMADQSWSSRDKVMDSATMKATIDRIAEHARVHRLPSVNAVLHGGEPLLAGTSWIDGFVADLRGVLEPDVQVAVSMQTNGTLIDEDFLRTAAERRIGVSVSLDGAEQDNDQHRRYAGGRGSYQAVARGLALLASGPYRAQFRGLLCTINVDNDPIGTYEELLRWRPPAIDFLLPHGTWSSPPPKRTTDEDHTPYADWLLEIFERWYTAPSRQTRVRLFESVIRMALGGQSMTEAVGLQPARLVVIETDGSIEQVDSLKAAFDGAPATGLTVRDGPFDRALEHPSVAARQIGIEALSEKCRACSLRDTCGGGLYPHRYREGSGFLNPSVYCPDLMKLITHIVGRVRADV